jgi:hypothetical protein
MEKLELIHKLKELEKTIKNAEKEINSLSIYIQPYFKRDINIEYTEYGCIITDSDGSFGTVEEFFIENDL